MAIDNIWTLFYIWRNKIVYQYEKRLLPRCIHHFKPDLINNMDHMRISVLNPRQWPLAKQTNLKRWKSHAPKVPKQAQAKRDGVINPQKYNWSQF